MSLVRIFKPIAIVGAILAGPWSAAQEWPRYRGADSDARVEIDGLFEGEFGLSIGWKKPLGSGYSGIAVARDALVTMFSDGASDVVVALDPATGVERWRSIVEPTYRGHDGSYDGPISTPLIADGRVFALGARGRFVALDLGTGEELWSRHLVNDMKASGPYYGFGSSPIFEAGKVLLQAGGDGGTLSAFDPKTGRLEWAAGGDAVQYQTPSIGSGGPDRFVLAVGETKVLAVDPRSGKVLWEYAHEGTGNQGAFSATPVAVGPDAWFLGHSGGGSRVFELSRAGAPAVPVLRWEEASIRNSYNVPVHHEGHVYGFSARFLTAVDVKDGAAKWKSRSPGDGFLILVDGHLVILTKTGQVAVGKASPDGFEVAAGIDVFSDLAWTAPSFADGSIFLRSLGEIARVDVVRARTGEPSYAGPRGLMADLASSVAASDDPGEVVDRFLAEHPERPILADGLVHFVYRGPGTDLAFAGDLLGTRREEPMTRIGDTDLFFYTASLAEGSRINYVFIRDYETITDPGNPRTTTSHFLNAEMEPTYGRQTLEMSWVSTPPWSAPSHLDPLPESAPRGAVIERRVESGVATLKIWLPPRYEDSTARYPVVYVDGSAALERGDWPLALDHLVGRRIEELIVVFVDRPDESATTDASLYCDGVIPHVDAHFRTEPRAARRALVGMGSRGLAVLSLALERQDVFGGVGVQSAFVYSPGLGGLEGVLDAVERTDLRVYLDWATYDLRNPVENWDTGAANRRIADALRGRGFAFSGGEVADGLGWANWRQRTDDLLEALFPASGPSD